MRLLDGSLMPQLCHEDWSITHFQLLLTISDARWHPSGRLTFIANCCSPPQPNTSPRGLALRVTVPKFL